MKESEKIDKYLIFLREIKKTVEHEGDGDTNSSWCTWNGPQRFEKETGRNGYQWKNRDPPSDYTVVDIGKYNQKSPGDLRRFTVTQTSVKDHQLTLV